MADDLQPAPQLQIRHPLFYNPSGLRPGWRLALYLAMVALLVAFVLAGSRSRPQPAAAFDPFTIAFGELILFLIAFLPSLVMMRIEDRTLAAYGLPLRRAFRAKFWIGALWGFASLSALLGVLHLFGAYSAHGLAIHGRRIVYFALFWAVTFLMVALFEEYAFRGYSLFTLTDGLGFWPAAVILSLGFGCAHLANPGENLVGAASAGVIGFFFCFTLRRTGDLWFAIGFHVSFDWAESYFYSVPNSGTPTVGHLLKATESGPRWLAGGSVGPEGSVFCFAMIAVLFWLFHRAYPEARFPIPDAPSVQPETYSIASDAPLSS